MSLVVLEQPRYFTPPTDVDEGRRNGCTLPNPRLQSVPIAQIVDIPPLDPEPEDFTYFDTAFGQPNNVVVVDHLVLTISLVPVSTLLLVDATEHLTLMRPRIVATDSNTPLAGTISIVSLMTLNTLIAASKDEMVHDLSLGLEDFVLAGIGPAIVQWNGAKVPPKN